MRDTVEIEKDNDSGNILSNTVFNRIFGAVAPPPPMMMFFWEVL